VLGLNPRKLCCWTYIEIRSPNLHEGAARSDTALPSDLAHGQRGSRLGQRARTDGGTGSGSSQAQENTDVLHVEAMKRVDREGFRQGSWRQVSGSAE
jgi:hypothetical protein